MKTIKLLIAVLLAAGLNTSYAQNTWTQKANFGGTARSDAAGFSIGGKGYIGTGYSSGTAAQNDFWEYDPVSNAWTQKANFGGEARFCAVGFSIGNKGYIGTGMNYGATIFYKDFWEYDPVANVWTPKADFGGTGRSIAAGFSIDGKGYIGTGGNYATVFKDFWEYDPGTNTWTQKADFGGTARWGAVELSVGNKGYIGTGATVGQNSYYKDFWEYDPGTDTWTEKANYPWAAGTGGTGFSIGSKGYVGTGQNNTTDSKEFWEYDPENNTWARKADLGGAVRAGTVGFSIGNKGYIGIGGQFGGGKLKDFWEYTPDNGCSAPTGMKVQGLSDTSAILKWKVAGQEILHVRVRYRVVGGTTWAIKNKQGDKPSVHIDGLTPNTTYQWQTRSFCTEDTSGWVAGPDFTTYGAVVNCDTLPPALSQNLVAYYPFCGNANDISGHKNNPTFNNATLTTDRFGNANSAYSFNGNAQYIKGICSNYPVNNRTVSVWFKISDLTKHNEILGYGGGVCGTSFFIALNETNHANQYTATGHCENHNCSTPNSYPPPAGWNNLIITSGHGVTKFYLNGILIDNFSTEFSGTTVNGKDFAFGSISSPGGVAPYTDTNLGYLNGDLDDIVIYNTDLDSTQVQQLYQFFNGGAVTKSSGEINNSNESKEIPVSPGKLSLYPNPSMGAITIRYNSGNPGPITINVYDFTNRKLFTKSSAAVKGMNTYHPDLTNLSPGLYYLELINNDEKNRIKFLIKK